MSTSTPLQPEDSPEPTNTGTPAEPEGDVEVVCADGHVLVIGDHRRDVTSFLHTYGLVERAQALGPAHLVTALRASSAVATTLSQAAAESGLWLKITQESAEAISRFGLTPSAVPGVSYAMAGPRGTVKKWLQIDNSRSATLSHPAALSGIAGALSQAAREQEAAQLHALLARIDHKLDRVLAGQRDDVLGDLAGIEREIRTGMHTRQWTGTVDTLTWSKIAGASLQLRQVQSKAVLKIAGIAEELVRHTRAELLNSELQTCIAEVTLWISTLARCAAALDELTILELAHYATLAPAQVNTQRLALDAARDHDRAQLTTSVLTLVQRMDATAARANAHIILHARGVPQAIRTINEARSVVDDFSRTLGIEAGGEQVHPAQWRAALREWGQWKNVGTEAAQYGWEKGKPVIGSIALAAVTALITKKLPGKK